MYLLFAFAVKTRIISICGKKINPMQDLLPIIQLCLDAEQQQQLLKFHHLTPQMVGGLIECDMAQINLLFLLFLLQLSLFLHVFLPE